MVYTAFDFSQGKRTTVVGGDAVVPCTSAPVDCQ